MKIVHAVSSELGTTYGMAGDQTGKEIRTQDWYKRSGGWSYYLEPIDPYLANKAVKIAVDVANNIHFGYSQPNRKDGYNLLKKADGDVSKVTEDGDFDCSSLVFAAYMLAGCPKLTTIGYTGSLLKLFMATGQFIQHTEEKFLTSGEYAVKGGIYLAPKAHTAMCIEDGKYAVHTVAKSDATFAQAIGKQGAEKTEEPKNVQKYVKAKGSVYVRQLPVDGKKIAIMHKNDILPYVGKDSDTGWYIVSCGYVTNKSRYTEIIEI